MTDLIHSHCSNCINLKKCQSYVTFTRNQKLSRTSKVLRTTDNVLDLLQRQRSNDPSDLTTGCQEERVGSDAESDATICDLITCPKKCDFVFHACKLGQHLLLCSKEVVRCINAQNGCEAVMERRFTGTHLEHCPASVVVCSMEWSRKCAAKVPFEQDSSHLDIAALNEDLETVKEFRRNVPASLRRLLQTRTHEIAMMPLGVAGHRIPDCICQVDLGAEGQQNGDLCESVPLTNGLETRVSPPAGLQLSLVQQLQLPASNSDNTAEWKTKLNEPNEKLLSLEFEVTSKHSGRFLACSTFTCSQELRRDEFADHFRNVHSDIRTQLDGWLFRRCPMASYGCPYGSLKFFPIMQINVPSSSYEIKYNSTLKSFCPTLKTELHNSASDETKRITLSDLPNELLLRLTTYLDPASLKCLTLTSIRMRNICGEVVSNRGIVVLDWEKNCEKSSGLLWHVRRKRWIFSTAFSPIQNWEMSEHPSIGNHLLNCPYYAIKNPFVQSKFAYASPKELSPHL